LRAQVAERMEMQPEQITHALVTEYRPGTQLGWHRDAPDFAMVVGISLGTPCRMRFRPYPPRAGQCVFVLDLAPRSMYVLAGGRALEVAARRRTDDGTAVVDHVRNGRRTRPPAGTA
jgi:alkylated DNA repair dioxygenase AlkB